MTCSPEWRAGSGDGAAAAGRLYGDGAAGPGEAIERVAAGRGGWDATPDRTQRLLNSARWDARGERDDLRGYVTGQLGDPGGF